MVTACQGYTGASRVRASCRRGRVYAGWAGTWIVVATLIHGLSTPALAQLGPRRTREFVTLYATNGISGTCSLPGSDPRLTLAVDHMLDQAGNHVPFFIRPGQTLVVKEIEYRVVTDAGRDMHLAIYGSLPGAPYSGHPRLTLPSRASDQGGNIGIAIQKGGWNPGVTLPAGQRPCIADALGGLIQKDPGASGVNGFIYILIHGYLTTK